MLRKALSVLSHEKAETGWTCKTLKPKRVRMEASVFEVSKYPLREQSH